MKSKRLLIAFAIVLMSLSGCQKIENEKSYGYLEHLCKQSKDAKEFAQKKLEAMTLEAGEQESKIKRCFYSYLREEVLTYVVAFEYTDGPEYKKYGYKIGINESQEYFVLEEGPNVASFLFNNE